MKKIVAIMFLAAALVFAQKVTVVEDVAVTSLKEGNFFYPSISPDGKSLLFTSENYKGLWSRDISTAKTVKITDANGAGYEPSFNSISQEIVFKHDKFINGKRTSSLVAFNLATKKESVLEADVRELKICRDNANVFKNYVKNKEVASAVSKNALLKTSAAEPVVYIEDSKIVLFQNNVKKAIIPFSTGNYIWASLSPDKTKLLFTFAGKGTYVTDLEGSILNKIGYANYPSWSADGNWIVFMKDIDDGINITSSDIYIANLKSGEYINLTQNKNDITLYPRWGKATNEIYYNTDNGQIRKIKLKYE